jgi:drug/metabolite transporter (DMT)-like permease
MVQIMAAELSQTLELDPKQFLGIPFALVGALFLSLGAQFQHGGVSKMEKHLGNSDRGLRGRQLLALFRRPSWMLGTALLCLAIVLQLVSLHFSPLTVVQPLGAVALVITAILNSRISRVKLNKRSIVAIGLCVGGVAAFVLIAAFTTVDPPVSDAGLVTILIILAVVLVGFGVLFAMFRERFQALMYIVAAGILYGFVATLAKVIISTIDQGIFRWLTVACLAGLLCAVGAGAYFVQNAYSSGPPDLVIAGLTVIDPLVAVTIGIVVLGEAANAGPFAVIGFIVSGFTAAWGVFLLSKNHPQKKTEAKVVPVG